MNNADDMQLEWDACHLALRVGATAMALWSILAAALWLGVAGATAQAAEMPAPTAVATPPMATTPAPSTATPSPVSGEYPPCESEDADGPCRWDAKTAGNGQGRSFTVEADGTVRYDDGETVAPENGGGGPAVQDDWRPSYPGESRTHIGYVDAGPAHVWEGPTDGTGEAGIDSRWHDQYGYPKREVLPSCDRVGSNESCAAPGYRILVSADCGRMIVDDDGHQWVQRKPMTCEPGVTPITHQWPDEDTSTATPSAPLEKSHKAKASKGSVSRKAYSDDAGLTGARDVQSPSATAADDSAVSDDAAASDAPSEVPAAVPAHSGGSLAHTGIDAGTVLGFVVVLIAAGVVIVAHWHGPREG